MDSELPYRHSIRMAHYDYAAGGAYFVTICTQDRKCLFGKIAQASMQLNTIGLIVDESWKWLAENFDCVHLDQWIIMPNHMHGIIAIEGSGRKPLGSIIGAFKSVSTKRIGEHLRDQSTKIWQRNYYEHIVRSDASLIALRQYIHDNPAQWEFDDENPNHTP